MVAETAREFEALEAQAARITGAFVEAGYERVAPSIIQPADVFLDVVGESLRARLNIPLEPGVQAAALFNSVPHPMSGADIEAVLVRASRRMAIEQQPALSGALLQDLIADFQPPGYPVEIEYQRLIAALECTSRQLLPPDLAELPHTTLAERLSRPVVAYDRLGFGRSSTREQLPSANFIR